MPAWPPNLSIGAAVRLFRDAQAFASRSLRSDMAPDGQRFLVVETIEEPQTAIRIVQKWWRQFSNPPNSQRRTN
jgi:hypothetical protein